MSTDAEFETEPVSADKLQSGKPFAASYAGEHVAGTEFVIVALAVGAVVVLMPTLHIFFILVPIWLFATIVYFITTTYAYLAQNSHE